MCVETKEATALKLVLRDANKQRRVAISEGILHVQHIATLACLLDSIYV